jgi:hypothetical protein
MPIGDWLLGIGNSRATRSAEWMIYDLRFDIRLPRAPASLTSSTINHQLSTINHKPFIPCARMRIAA